MTRRRMLHAFKAEVGEYEDAPVLPVETDPQLFMSRNTQPQPFHLICSKDNVLSLLSGAADVHLRDSSVNRFRMTVGDHVYIPAGTPHRIVPAGEGVMLRFQPQEAGLQGTAWYCDGCDSELRRYEWEHDHDTPPAEYYAAACARFSADEAARTCGKCGTIAAPVDLAAFGWPLAQA
jgi:mannose-6-phosphate isomerase-like protein (cupin superfamily)